jgi:predicted dinucleotide-binding enzyme
LSATHLGDLDQELDEDVLICGDRRQDKSKVAELVELVPGLRPVDCGRLELARIVEQLTALLISINNRHKTQAGIKVTGLPC